MSQLALQRISENKRTQNPVLNLRNCQLSELPRELLELTYITTLYLNDNELIDVSDLATLSNLESLDLSRNELIDISPLISLINLTKLDLNYNNITDVTVLAGLNDLKELALRCNTNIDLTTFNGFLSLEELDLSYNDIKDVSSLANLPNLPSLDLSGNTGIDISGLATLINLEYLDLSETELKDILALSGLFNLTTLDISENPSIDISSLANLTSLQALYLNKAPGITIFPIASLINLKLLSLNDNDLIDISNIPNLKKLETLDLSGNKFTSFHGSFLNKFPLLSTLILYDNPIQNIPWEILGSDYDDNCLENVRNFFKEQNFEELFETKLILIGNGMVGKTCLAERLTQNTFTERNSEDRTHGIVIENWEHEGFRLNVWDFGGQDIYHATHRLFLSHKAMYLLVWAKETQEKATEERYELAYWLDYIQHLGAESKIVIVQNQCDLHGEQDVSGKEELKASYPITHIRSVSAKRGNGIVALKEAITENLQKYKDEYSRLIPAKWLKVKRDLEDYRAQKSISYEVYLKLCKKAGLTGTSHATLILYLHNSGFLYYKAGLFNNQLILDQMWAIDAVYEVFHPKKRFKFEIAHNQGRLTKDYLEEIWESYSTKEREVFLNFMLGAELCFALEANWEYEIKATFVIPQLLPEDNGVLNSWDTKDALVVKYQHRFLHKGIMERFIARTHQLAGEHNFWKNGILLSDKSRQTQALITFKKGAESNQITIRVKGKEQKQMLDEISNEFVSLNAHQEIEKWVSLDGIYFVSWKVLEKKYRKGNREIDAQDGTTLLVSDFAPFMGERTKATISEEIKKAKIINQNIMYKQVFISYRTKDLDRVKVIQQHFPSNVQFKLDYQDIDAGANLTTSIKQMVRDSGVTVFVVSENSLSSAWCMMEFLETSKHEDIHQNKRYISVCLDFSFLDREANLTLLDIANSHLEEIGRLITEVKKKGGRADDLEEEEKLWYEFKAKTGPFLKRLKTSLVLDFSTEEKMKENMPKLLAAITD